MSALSDCLEFSPESLVLSDQVLHLLLHALVLVRHRILLFATELQIFLDFVETLLQPPDSVDVLILELQS